MSLLIGPTYKLIVVNEQRSHRPMPHLSNPAGGLKQFVLNAIISPHF